MDLNNLTFSFLFSVLLISPAGAFPLQAEPGEGEKHISLYAADNEKNCLVCHGKLLYTITDTVTGVTMKRLMSEQNVINPDVFYNSVHWSFNCLDCHAEGFKSFPHPLEARFESGWNCLDCHGNDPNYAQYKFEEIDAEFKRSVHYTATEGVFTCWNCHNAHYYNPLARQDSSSRDQIYKSNAMCLRCHGNPDIMG